MQRALEKAFAFQLTASNIGTLHAARSRAWVACLAEELRVELEGEDVVVFTKFDERNRRNFGLNELLYDISICETGTLTSVGKGKTLHYISKAVWQIESELAEGNSAEWIKDFNKLVIGCRRE